MSPVNLKKFKELRTNPIYFAILMNQRRKHKLMLWNFRQFMIERLAVAHWSVEAEGNKSDTMWFTS